MELSGLLAQQSVPQSSDREARIFRLLTIVDRASSPLVKAALPPGYLALRRAEALASLGHPELALLEVEEARRASSDEPESDFFYLELLRRTNLERAVQEAEAIIAKVEASAQALAGGINLLATWADELSDAEFLAVAEQLSSRPSASSKRPGAIVFAPRYWPRSSSIAA